MVITLLATKLYIPTAGPQLILRTRLAQQITAALQQAQRLVLLAAPAGFGKTTAVVGWIQSTAPPHVAWIALDDDDNSLGRFLAYLIAAVETTFPGAGQQASVLLRAADEAPPVRPILTELLNALAASSEQFVLVLEDYHVIIHDPIHAAVAFLLEHMPPQMHLIITSRSDPPLPLARLRARRQLAELRAADLRFTPAEAEALLAQGYGMELSPAALQALETRTEGWPAGLQLAGLALSEHEPAQREPQLFAFTGSHRYVFDYLADEVFYRQPASLQFFLIQTAILRRMCASLCTMLTGELDSQALLEQLERANLFVVRLDHTRTWYRYHHLFADFLYQRLLQRAGEAGIEQMHQRVSAWFENQGFLEEAIEHALAAKAWERMLSLVARLATGQEFPNYFLDWKRWVAVLPDQLLHSYPDRALALAQNLVLLGQFEVAERLLRIIDDVWQATQDTAKLGQVLVIRTGVALLCADHTRACMLAEQALEQLAADDLHMRQLAAYLLGLSSALQGNIARAEAALAQALDGAAPEDTTIWALGSRAALGVTAYLRGRLREAAMREEALIEQTESKPANRQSVSFIYLGLVQYEWNDLVAAEATIGRGIAIGEQTGRIRYWPLFYWVLARIATVRGDWQQAEAHLAQAHALTQMLGSQAMLSEVEIWEIQVRLLQGDLEAAQTWLRRNGLSVDDPLLYQRQSAYLLFVRIQLFMARQSGTGDLAGTTQVLIGLIKAAEEANRFRDAIRILVILAQAYALRGEREQAAQSLIRALLLAEPENYIRTFIDEGPALLEMLSWPEVQQIAPGYTERLITAGGWAPSLARDGAPNGETSLLSARELDILHLLAQGQSLHTVSTTLVISVHTARTHVKNIYGKLGVHNRVQALARAQELHLI